MVPDSVSETKDRTLVVVRHQRGLVAIIRFDSCGEHDTMHASLAYSITHTA